jgi:hypothetical protein
MESGIIRSRGIWRNFWRKLGVFKAVRRPAIIVACVLAICALIEAIYVPRLGPEALRAARNEYLTCVSDPPLIELSRRRRVNDFRPSQADCLGFYLDRQEAIKWRYFLLQTLASHL